MNNKSLWTKNFILIGMINFLIFVGYNMTIVGIPLYVTKLGGSSFVVGLMTSFASIAALIIRPFSGSMLDHYGYRNVLLISLCAISLIILGYAIFPILGLILVLRIVHGIGWGLGSTAASTIASDSVPQSRFAEGMGYIALTTALSSAIAPAISISMFNSIGVRPMMLVSAGLTVLAFCLVLLKEKSNVKVKVHTKKKKLQLSDLFDKKALLPAVMNFLICCAFASVSTFIVLHGEARGIEHVSLYFIVYAIVSIITRPVIGKLIDKKGFFMPGILAAVGVAITLVLISIATNIIVLCIGGAIAGLGLGTAMGTFQTMAVSTVPKERRGVATSTWLLGTDLGNAVGAAIAGGLSGILGYSGMYLAMSTFAIAAAIVFIVIGKERILSYTVK